MSKFKCMRTNIRIGIGTCTCAHHCMMSSCWENPERPKLLEHEDDAVCLQIVINFLRITTICPQWYCLWRFWLGIWGCGLGLLARGKIFEINSIFLYKQVQYWLLWSLADYTSTKVTGEFCSRESAVWHTPPLDNATPKNLNFNPENKTSFKQYCSE